MRLLPGQIGWGMEHARHWRYRLTDKESGWARERAESVEGRRRLKTRIHLAP